LLKILFKSALIGWVWGAIITVFAGPLVGVFVLVTLTLICIPHYRKISRGTKCPECANQITEPESTNTFENGWEHETKSRSPDLRYKTNRQKMQINEKYFCEKCETKWEITKIEYV
jgi:hypothetical protein